MQLIKIFFHIIGLVLVLSIPIEGGTSITGIPAEDQIVNLGDNVDLIEDSVDGLDATDDNTSGGVATNTRNAVTTCRDASRQECVQGLAYVIGDDTSSLGIVNAQRPDSFGGQSENDPSDGQTGNDPSDGPSENDPREQQRYNDPREQQRYNDPREQQRYSDPRGQQSYEGPREQQHYNGRGQKGEDSRRREIMCSRCRRRKGRRNYGRRY